MPDYSDSTTWLTPQQVAKQLRRQPDTIRWYIREKGWLPATRVGRRLLIHRDDVARLVERLNAEADTEDHRALALAGVA
jgi:excisionase family DNA binding protein